MGMVFIILSACSRRTAITSSAPENNDSYVIHYLFEHDGCRVYRFYDKGNDVYFTNCNGEATSFSDDTTSVRVKSLNLKSRINDLE